MDDKTLTLLNGYLDQTLDDQEVLGMAERFAQDEQLKTDLAEFMQVKQLVKALPVAKPPRNYILTRAMAQEVRKPSLLERLFPAFRTAAVFACLGLIFTFMLPFLGLSQSAPQETAYVDKSISFYGGAPMSAKTAPETEANAALPTVQSLQDIGLSDSSNELTNPSKGFRGGSPKLEYLVTVDRVMPDDRTEALSGAEDMAAPDAALGSGEGVPLADQEAEVQRLIGSPETSAAPLSPLHIAQIVLIVLLAVCIIWIVVTLLKRRALA